MYKLHLWKANMGDNGPENGTETHEYTTKPTFQDMYKHIGCDMIEILHGYDKDISGRTFDIYCDEESKLKNPFIKVNKWAEAKSIITEWKDEQVKKKQEECVHWWKIYKDNIQEQIKEKINL